MHLRRCVLRVRDGIVSIGVKSQGRMALQRALLWSSHDVRGRCGAKNIGRSRFGILW